MSDDDDAPIAFTADGRPLYNNAATVVCLAVFNSEGKLYAIRRNTEPGKGLLALPGGFQMRGESWQWCGRREFYEETGMIVEAGSVKLLSVTTDEYQHNVIVGTSNRILSGNDIPKPNLAEVQEIIELNPPLTHYVDSRMTIDQWAFPIHFYAAQEVLKAAAEAW